MLTQAKIKIDDDKELRIILDHLYQLSSQIQLCQYALLLADHILEIVGYRDIHDSIIQQGYLVNKEWQKGHVRMHDVRQAAFLIHQLARTSDHIFDQIALRVVGHAVATAHMKEHAMVASDYAIKVMNIKFPGDKCAVQKERKWQIDILRNILNYEKIYEVDNYII